MQILVFTTTYVPFIGGAEVAIGEIARRSPQHEWVLFCARLDRALPETEVIENITVRRLGWGNERMDKYLLPLAAFFAAQRHIAEALHTGRCALLWPVMASYGAFGALLVKLRYPQAPLLLTLQEGDSETHVRRRLFLTGPLRALLFRRLDYVTVISRYLGDLARRLGYKGRITVVPNGVDGKLFAMTEERIADSEIIKKSLGVPAGTKVIVTVSRLVEKNGLEDLLHGMKRLQERRQEPPHLIIVGDGPLKERLETLIQELEIIDIVHPVGSIKHSDVPRYLAIADVFARPSRSEGLGNAFLEAMMAGVPVVGTAIGGIPDFLVDGETGLFCQSGDADSVTLALERLLDDKALRERVIRQAYALVSEQYSWDGIAAHMNEIFNKLRPADCAQEQPHRF